MVIDAILNNKTELTAKALSRVLEPIDVARGLPNACYTDPMTNEVERQRVFVEGWACAEFSMNAPVTGDLFPFEFAGLPLFMVRGTDGTIWVFHNVCQHRGRILVEKPKNVKKSVICPYHNWTYSLEGELIGTPHVGGAGKNSCPNFNRENIRLSEVRSAEWFGLVFVDLSGVAVEFTEYISPIAERWRAFEGVPLVHTGADCSIEFDLACNWKLPVENYCEAYHLPWVHPHLNSYSPLGHHYSIVGETYSGQSCEFYSPNFPEGTREFPDAPSLPSFWETGAEYIAFYPNVLLGMHRDHFYAVLIQPDGLGRTHERFEIFYYHESVRGPMFDAPRAANRKRWQTIFEEDKNVVESMQCGRQSPGFDGGVFSPAMDHPTYVFHPWIPPALLEGLQPNLTADESSTTYSD